MALDGITGWIIATGFGAFMVGMYSWTRFDEPSYDTQSEYFSRYKPRYSTSKSRYARAKWAYIGAIILFYGIFCLVPELFTAIGQIDATNGNSKSLEGSNVPLAIALAIITLQNAPGLKDLERRIRGFLHSFARIPEGVRRTVAQMRGSPFTFESQAIRSQTRKLGLQIGNTPDELASLNKLIHEDEVLHGWFGIGSVLFRLSEQNRATTGIDPLFFDYYKDELDSINLKHLAIAGPVRELLAGHFPANAAPVLYKGAEQDSEALREVRDLRDRLYTFIACGVHSSAKSDAASFEIVRKLGFAITPSGVEAQDFVGPLAGLAAIVFAILSIFTGFTTQLFRTNVLLPVGQVWQDAFPVPREPLELYAWTLSSAAFYFIAILGALALRNSRISNREWFDINNLDRETPVLRYITPTLLGTALGCVTLTLIALINGPAFNVTFHGIGGALMQGLEQALPWVPLATVMAFIAILLSDAQLKYDGSWLRKVLTRACYGALVMGVVGFLTSTLILWNGIESYAVKHGLEVTSKVEKARLLLALYLAAQISLVALALCVIIQVRELYTGRSRSLAGRQMRAVTVQGPMFYISLDVDGKAVLSDSAKGAAVLCEGQWQQFPEGTVIKWIAPSDVSSKAGNVGLISTYGDSLIYEGYVDGFAGTAQFIFQIHLLTKSAARGVWQLPRAIAGEPNGQVAAVAELEPAIVAPAIMVRELAERRIG